MTGHRLEIPLYFGAVPFLHPEKGCLCKLIFILNP